MGLWEDLGLAHANPGWHEIFSADCVPEKLHCKTETASSDSSKHRKANIQFQQPETLNPRTGPSFLC